MFLYDRIEWLVQERSNSIANALELRISCNNPSVCNIMCYANSKSNEVSKIFLSLAGKNLGAEMLLSENRISIIKLNMSHHDSDIL